MWLCNALNVGPPGAYVFVVACAAGIGVSASHLSPPVPAITAAAQYLSHDDATSLAARTSRRNLQRATLDMLDAHRAAEHGHSGQRAAARRLWPDVVATERTAYRVIAQFWGVERAR